YLVQNSLLSDCYFYLGYVNRDNVLKIKNQIHRNPEFIHVLKIGLDMENDPKKTMQNAIVKCKAHAFVKLIVLAKHQFAKNTYLHSDIGFRTFFSFIF